MSDWDGIPEHWGAGRYRDIPVCKWVRLARERQIRMLTAWKKDLSYPYYYDDKAADHVINFFSKRIKHTKLKSWAGKPFIPEGWQEWDLLRPLFGWKRKEDGFRLYRKALLMTAKKNGKTIQAAGIGNYGLSSDNEPGAEIFCVATKEKQADEIFGEAQRQVMKDRTLRRHIKLYVNKLTCPELNGKMVKLGADTKTEDGHNPHFALVDELHAHPDNTMLMQMEDAIGTRDEPLIFITSTAGVDELSPCKVEQEYAEAVLLGEIPDDSYFVYLCTVDDPEKWEDEAEWYKANPQLGVSIKLDEFRAKFERARRIPSKRTNFLIKNLNIWASAESSWMPPEEWDRGNGPIDWSRFAHRPCIAGLDIGRVADMTAFVLAFFDPDFPGHVALQAHYWMPERQDLAKREREDAAAYRQWIADGWIYGCPRASVEDDSVFEKIQELRKQYDIVRVVGDRYSAANIFDLLEKAGVKIEKMPQTALAFRAPIDQMEKRIPEGQMHHGDNPVLRWNVMHAKKWSDGNGNHKFMKDKSRHRIDGLMAATMAVGLLTVMPASKVNPYKRHGIRYL